MKEMQDKQTKQAELLKSQNGMNQQDNSKLSLNSELVKREKYKDTPIWIVEFEEKNFAWLTIGKYKLKKNYSSKESAIKDLEKPSIDLIIEITGIMIQLFNEFENKEK